MRQSWRQQDWRHCKISCPSGGRHCLVVSPDSIQIPCMPSPIIIIKVPYPSYERGRLYKRIFDMPTCLALSGLGPVLSCLTTLWGQRSIAYAARLVFWGLASFPSIMSFSSEAWRDTWPKYFSTSDADGLFHWSEARRQMATDHGRPRKPRCCRSGLTLECLLLTTGTLHRGHRGVTVLRNSPQGLRDDDDDDVGYSTSVTRFSHK